MTTPARTLLAAAALLACALPALADDVGDRPDRLTLTADPVPPGPKKDRFDLGVRVEYWEVDALEIVGSDNVGGLTDDVFEEGVEIDQFHSAALLQGDYTHSFSSAFFRIHAGLGFERMGTRTVDDTPSGIGITDFDDVYDTDLVLEIGGAFGFQFDKTTDGLVSVTYRSGESEVNREGNVDVTYEYTMIRVTGEVGFMPNESARFFGGLRYTLYEAEYELSAPNPVYSWELEFDQPLGLSLGVDLLSTAPTGGVAARIELQFVDVLGFVASAGWRF